MSVLKNIWNSVLGVPDSVLGVPDSVAPSGPKASGSGINLVKAEEKPWYMYIVQQRGYYRNKKPYKVLYSNEFMALIIFKLSLDETYHYIYRDGEEGFFTKMPEFTISCLGNISLLARNVDGFKSLGTDFTLEFSSIEEVIAAYRSLITWYGSTSRRLSVYNGSDFVMHLPKGIQYTYEVSFDGKLFHKEISCPAVVDALSIIAVYKIVNGGKSYFSTKQPMYIEHGLATSCSFLDLVGEYVEFNFSVGNAAPEVTMVDPGLWRVGYV